MTEPVPQDERATRTAEAMRRHADSLIEIQRRVEAIRFIGTVMERDAAAYGSLFGWLAECLEERFSRQDELVAMAAKNLELAAKRLRSAAKAYEAGGDARAEASRDEYWAPQGGHRHAEPGPKLADQIRPLLDRIAGRSWADPRLAEEPHWNGDEADELTRSLRDSVPVRHLIDQMTGNPVLVVAQAAAWTDMADQLQTAADDLARSLESDLAEWTGADRASYHWLMTHNVSALEGSGMTARLLAASVEGAGAVTSLALFLIRVQSRDLAMQLAALAARNPDDNVVSRALPAAACKWALLVGTHLQALARSLANLKQLLTN